MELMKSKILNQRSLFLNQRYLNVEQGITVGNMIKLAVINPKETDIEVLEMEVVKFKDTMASRASASGNINLYYTYNGRRFNNIEEI